jgi:predicted ATPase
LGLLDAEGVALLRAALPPHRERVADTRARRKRHNLPVSSTRLTGRDEEVARVRKLVLEDDCRLLTICGVGGSGKTSVALQVASEIQDHFPDGVWLVELAPLAKHELVSHAVATVLNVGEQPGESLVETICRAVANRKMLLVLDNCEHLIAACAELAQ